MKTQGSARLPIPAARQNYSRNVISEDISMLFLTERPAVKALGRPGRLALRRVARTKFIPYTASPDGC
jgi:hypothetical protein